MRQPVGARVKLPIREAFLLKHHRKRIRPARRLRRKQPRQARTSNRTRRRVPTPQDAGTLLPPQDVHAAQRSIGLRHQRFHHTDQPPAKTLKRYIRMAVGREVEGANTPNQIAQPRIARRIRAQHKRVDEEPNKLIQRTVRATRNRAPDRYVLASPKPAQKPGNTSLQQHEQARTTLPRNPNEPRVQLSRQPQPNHLPAMARHRRTSTVARQRYRFRKPRQRFLPVPKLARDRAPRIALIPQNLLLP